MKKYKGIGLTPLFHSEISSSYILYDIFKNHEQIIVHFIKDHFILLPEKITIERERKYSGEGSIDIFVEFMITGKKYALLIEVKVHDYKSAKDGQISTYYNAVIEDGVYDSVYFIYLTQFTEQNDFTNIATPKTIDEAKNGKELIKERFSHISWEQLHVFLNQYSQLLTEEQRLMLSLQKQWILEQCRVDLESNKIDVGERALEDYFSDIKIDISKVLPFGNEVFENNRKILRVDTSKLSQKKLDAILDVIKNYSNSDAVNKIKQYKTDESTLQAAKDFLSQMAQSTEEWPLLPFYTELFNLAEKENYLKFNGTGTRGFSIKLEVKGKSEISLCTIYRNKTIDFAIKR